MAYLEGVRVGRESGGGNPFSVIIKKVSEAQDRKLAEQEEDRKQLTELQTLFQTLEKKHEYDTAVERQKAEIGLQLEKEKGIQDRLTEISKGYEVDTGEEAVTTQKNVNKPSSDIASVLGLGTRVKKREVTVSLSPEEALTKIPQGANPDDYEPKAVIRNIKGVPTEIYVANKKPEVIAANKKQDTLRIEAETQEKEVNAMIDSVWSKAEELIPAQETGRAGVIKGAERSYRASGIGRLFSGGKGDKEQTGEKARAYKDYQLGTLSLLIRSLGEKGVLTDQDIKRSKEFEPKFGDSITLRNTKREAMREFLKSKLQAHIKDQGLQAKVESQSNDPEYQKYLQAIGQ